MSTCIGVSAVTSVMAVMSAASPPLDMVQAAAAYFAEAKEISVKDAGRLWGVGLYGPMMFVDRNSRRIVANQADRLGLLRPAASPDGPGGQPVFVGTLPIRENIANTAVDWSGVRWTMLVWPPPQDPRLRGCMLAHEMWHRVQRDLGFPPASPSNAHLTERDGRIWLILEWRALQAALAATGDERNQAVEDAILFRSYRRSLFAPAASEENALELNEGLAEYTGIRLSTASRAEGRTYATEALARAQQDEMFARSFAYSSGPAWGLLLDEHVDDWRKRLRVPADLAEILREALGLPVPSDLAATAKSRAKRYDGDAVILAETKKDDARRDIIQKVRDKFVRGPIVRIPLSAANIGFDPDRVQPIPDAGNLYYAARLTDAWGVLEADAGVLVNEAWTWAQVPADFETQGSKLAAPGWKLELAPDWQIVAEGRGHVVRRKQ